jgi:hypothetical protein
VSSLLQDRVLAKQLYCITTNPAVRECRRGIIYAPYSRYSLAQCIVATCKFKEKIIESGQGKNEHLYYSICLPSCYFPSPPPFHIPQRPVMGTALLFICSIITPKITESGQGKNEHLYYSICLPSCYFPSPHPLSIPQRPVMGIAFTFYLRSGSGTGSTQPREYN